MGFLEAKELGRKTSDNDETVLCVGSLRLGNNIVRFTGLQGSLSQHLQLDPTTGAVKLGNGTGFRFDREKSDSHYVTVEVKDDNGQGNANTVELVVRVRDANDNAPLFSAVEYQSFLLENSPKFKVPLVVTATDSDQEGTENAEVRFTIVEGDPRGNFTVDSNTGEITPTGVLDYEQMLGDTYNLTVRAFDLGSPSLSADVTVVIFLIDQNDNPPLFSQMEYSVSIPEDIAGLSPVLQVNANDRDGSSPNNHIVYRIQSGAKDKFVINPETGMISVSEGANLDPDLTSPSITQYPLEVVAIDGGIGSEKLTGWTRVTINITDVNNKPPRFAKIDPVLVSEDATIGLSIRQLFALDPDSGAILRYSLNMKRSEARSGEGRLIKLTDYDWSSMFSVNENTGVISVTGMLDREMIAEYKLEVMVEDIAADTRKPQVAFSSVHVAVLDVNDNSPQFTMSEYKGMVSENSGTGTKIMTVLATDLDVNRTIRYSLKGKPRFSRMVSIDDETGEIFVSGKIDREVYDWLNLTVGATDSGNPVKTSFASVFIQV